jgi:hypothetical protein
MSSSQTERFVLQLSWTELEGEEDEETDSSPIFRPGSLDGRLAISMKEFDLSRRFAHS